MSDTSKENILVSTDKYLPSPSHVEYYSTLKGAAYIEPTATTKSNLLSEDEFVKAHGGPDKVYSGFKDPYTEDEKKILLENYRREPATRRALDILAEFTLGERTELVMDTPNAYADQKRQDEAIKTLTSDPMLIDYLDELATIDERVNATDRFTELLISGENFGRSVLVKQYDEDGIPIRLIPLASIRLGKVFCDAETWELLGIEYKDYKGEQRILKKEDIIHYEPNDFHITPNTRYMGAATAEPTMYTAMSLRTAYEIAIPEIRKSKWAPFHILQFPQIQSQEKLDEIAAQIQPGKSQVWGEGQIMVHKVDLNNINLKELYDSIIESQKEIFRSFGIALVFAFQDEQNRATAQFSSNLMRVTKLTKIRTRLRNVLEPQWYEPNLRALMKRRQKETGLEEPSLEQYQETGLVNALEKSARILKVDPNALPFKPRMKFVDKKVDTFLEISAAALGWYQAGIIDEEMAAEIGGLDQFLERIAAKQAEAERMRLTTPAPGTMPLQESVLQNPQESQAKLNPIPSLPLSTSPRGASSLKSLDEETTISRAKIAKELLQTLRELNTK
jgi:hypothetical protein